VPVRLRPRAPLINNELPNTIISFYSKRSGLRLTKQVKNEIRSLIKSGMKQVNIAHEFGVSPPTICDIKYGRL